MTNETTKGWLVVRDGERISKHLNKSDAEARRDELNKKIGDGHFIRTVE